MSKQISKVAVDAMDILMRYTWPGNIRDLHNFIEGAVVLTSSEILRVPPLPSTIPTRTEPMNLAEAERDHILKTLEESNWIVGGKSGAAARLGVKRTTLIDNMRKRGLSRAVAQGQL